MVVIGNRIVLHRSCKMMIGNQEMPPQRLEKKLNFSCFFSRVLGPGNEKKQEDLDKVDLRR